MKHLYPTNEQILECLDMGMTVREIAEKFGRNYQTIQNRAATLHFEAEKQRYVETKNQPPPQTSEDQIMEERRFAVPTVGDILVVEKTMIHRYTLEIIN